MSKPKLLWHSNAPWASTGYGMQTALVAPRLADRYDLRISAFYGLEAAPIAWEDIMVLPSFGGTYGADELQAHAHKFFGGDPHGGMILTLMDVWVLPPRPLSRWELTCWVPVDHDPVPPGVKGFLSHTGAVPIAMSRFGQERLADLGALYCPHAVDTNVMRPMDRREARTQLHLPEDHFIVGCVAANKGNPSRKSLVAVLEAFADFRRRNPESMLYLHTDLDGSTSQGVFLPAVIEALGIPSDAIIHPDPYVIHYRPLGQEMMAALYAAMDVLVNPSTGEGFGIPVLEAQACGTPAVVTDCTAMSEVCGSGWKISGSRWWTSQRSWQVQPSVRELIDALDDCHTMPTSERDELSAKAREHALQYDIETVMSEHMLPALEIAEKRHEARRPATIKAARRYTATIVTPWRDHPEFKDGYWQAIGAAEPKETLIIDDGSRVPIEGAAHRFEQSVGFSKACNKGLELATGDVVVFLNNDVRMVRWNWLDVILQAIRPGVLVGPMLRDDPHTWVDGEPIPYLDGWCLAGMREDFQRIGGWETSYEEPCYFGDNDVSLRAKVAGMQLVEVPIGLEHLLNGTTNDDPDGRLRVTIQNRQIYEARARMMLEQMKEKEAA